MTAGPISFRAATDVSAGVIEGRLHLDAHGDSPFRGRDEVRGVVGRIQLVPLRYVEQAERHFVPAEQLDAVEVDTTLAREQLRSREAEHVYVDLLVWLEIPDEQPHHG